MFQGHLDRLAVSTIQALTAVMHKSPAAKVTVSMRGLLAGGFLILFPVSGFYHKLLMNLANEDVQIMVMHSCQIGIAD